MQYGASVKKSYGRMKELFGMRHKMNLSGLLYAPVSLRFRRSYRALFAAEFRYLHHINHCIIPGTENYNVELIHLSYCTQLCGNEHCKHFQLEILRPES
jgi:hypothetical protein